jgi:hypothetical protein
MAPFLVNWRISRQISTLSRLFILSLFLQQKNQNMVNGYGTPPSGARISYLSNVYSFPVRVDWV